MKKYFKNYKIAVILLGILALNSCQEDYLEIPPQDAYSLEGFYNSNEKVANATNNLYCRVWFNFHTKAFNAIGDMAAGNTFTYSSDYLPFRTLEYQSSDPVLSDSWRSCFGTVANANTLINGLPSNVGPNVSEQVLNNTLGECHFMRALAYFYLVRLWGNVPIIEDAADFADDPNNVASNPKEDVYKFIENDLLKAIELLNAKVRGANYTDNAHVSKGSAKSLLAKVYLYQKKYTEARAMAEDVINSGEFKLYGGPELPGKTYGDLFLVSNNNNEESIMAWQWTTGNYFVGNYDNTQFALPELSQNSYGGVVAPSQDLIDNAFVPGDLRRKETFMLPGDFYPNLTYAISATETALGFTVPNTTLAQNSGAALKKYVVGRYNLPVTGQFDPDNRGFPQNTYIMRYADVLLIHAEAILGAGASTSDAMALASFNQVRARAGIPSLATITFTDILKERRSEFAIESEYWYDLGRLPYADAKAIIEGQNRGDAANEVHVTLNPAKTSLLFPYPASELLKNSRLDDEPVPYIFD
jgi:starch-binding outer membrane protein, SusD/RagB family